MQNSLPNEPVAFVGMLFEDPDRVVIPGSQPRPCRRCEKPVSLTPASIHRMRLCDVVLCLSCATVIAQDRGSKWHEVERNAEQLHELKVLKCENN